MLINQNNSPVQHPFNGLENEHSLLTAFFFELKKIVEVRSQPFNFHKQIDKGPTLFVGEGNLSFSLHFASNRNIRSRFITATTFEPASKLSEEAEKNASQLRMLDASVHHGIDATRLEHHFSNLRFSTIIFNFPNVASRAPKYGRNPNHMLVRKFLMSATNILDKDGLVLISSVDSPHYRGAFQFPLAAEKSGFQESTVYRFYPSNFKGYTHTNTQDEDSALSDYNNFCTWVFQKA